jgi:putative membrane protein
MNDATGNIILDFIERKISEPLAEKADQQAHPSLAGKNLAKGLLAGMIGGLVATAAKTLAEKVYPPRTHGEPEPPEVLAEKIAGHELAEAPKAVAAETIHWAFGAAAGAAYGALAEFYPAATGRQGTNFGMTLMALTHEGALPALGLSAEPAEQTTREKSSEMASHVVFGFVAEYVRRHVREAL